MASTKKQQKQRSEKSIRDKRVLLAKEKVLKIKRDILKVVESMLEVNIPKEWFLENCVKLCQQDYEDVIQERCIEYLCGYPLCNKPINKVIKQQYKISRSTNKVYDVTERKCFCSNVCYKASNYLKAQLSEVPLYMRKTGASISVNLISESDNRGCAGDEIVFEVSVNKEEIEEPCAENPLLQHLSTILQEEVKGCEDHLSNLKITEKVYEKSFVLSTETEDEVENDTINGNKSTVESNEQDDSDDNDELAIFPEYNNVSMLSNKQMPISDRTKKAVLISPIKPADISDPPTVHPSIEFIANIFYDWFTEDTMKYLLGERKMYSMKADLLFQAMINSEALNSEKLASVKNEYIDLCLKIDKIQEEELSDSVEFEIDALSSVGDREIASNSSCNLATAPPNANSVSEQNIASANSIPKRRPKRKFEGKKTVSFMPSAKDIPKEQLVPPEVSETNPSLSEPTFPLVDSMSQNALRRQVLSGKLKAVYFDALPVVGLNFRDIRDGVKKIVETFSLTPRNITYKPKEWKCIAVVLFRILTETTLNDLESIQFSKLYETTLKNISISVQEIEDLVSDLVSSNQLQRLQGL